jgi:hypothetical protein
METTSWICFTAVVIAFIVAQAWIECGSSYDNGYKAGQEDNEEKHRIYDAYDIRLKD